MRKNCKCKKALLGAGDLSVWKEIDTITGTTNKVVSKVKNTTRKLRGKKETSW